MADISSRPRGGSDISTIGTTKEIAAGLSHFHIVMLTAALSVVWFVKNHWLLSALVAGFSLWGWKSPRNASWAFIFSAGTILAFWMIGHIFLTGIISIGAFAIYTFADDQAKIRMNVAARRLWRQLSEVLSVAKQNVGTVGGNVKGKIVDSVHASAQTLS
jgi:hypothetical protein